MADDPQDEYTPLRRDELLQLAQRHEFSLETEGLDFSMTRREMRGIIDALRFRAKHVL